MLHEVFYLLSSNKVVDTTHLVCFAPLEPEYFRLVINLMLTVLPSLCWLSEKSVTKSLASFYRCQYILHMCM